MVMLGQDNGKLLAILLAFAIGVLTQVAIAAEKAPVKINYVTGSLSVDKKSGRSGDLNSISFSIENAANRPLEWVKLRVTARSPNGALIQTETFEEDLSKNPIASTEARRITRFMSIDGFRIDGKQGSIDIDVSDYWLSPEGGWISLNTKDPTYVSYFNDLIKTIEQNWEYPELALRYGLQGKLSLRFTIATGGQIEQLRVSRSTGSSVLDLEAVRAIKTAAPFPPIPPWIKPPLPILADMEYEAQSRSVKIGR
jgi:TonB family protein